MVHGSTVATNAILEAKGARTALTTTRGSPDALALTRQRRPSLFDLQWEKPVPMVPRYLCLEVTERINAKGEIQTALDIGDLKAAARRLRDSDVTAVAVCLINSYINPAHEKLVCERLSQELPGVLVSGSFDILSECGEYERTSTTVVDAVARPVVVSQIELLALVRSSFIPGIPRCGLRVLFLLEIADDAFQRTHTHGGALLTAGQERNRAKGHFGPPDCGSPSGSSRQQLYARRLKCTTVYRVRRATLGVANHRGCQ
jgi:hypothetical protein